MEALAGIKNYLILGGFLAMIPMMMSLWFVIIIPNIEQWSRRYFIAFFTVLLLFMVVCIIDAFFVVHPEIGLLSTTVIYFEYLFSSVLMPMQTAYLLHCYGEDLKRSRLFRVVLVLWGVFFVLLGVAQFTTCFYYITPDNHYFRGALHPLLIIPIFLIEIIALAMLIHRRKELSRKYYYAFLIFLFPTVVLTALSGFFDTFLFIIFAMSVCSFVVYSILISDQIAQYTKQQHEIAHQRASIMVLQMRPHFIYNAMTSIYYLCEQNTEKAQEVIIDFTTYLQKNFTAIASESMIPFSEELQHTRAYLAVEQAQFEDRLFVNYDTTHTHFFLPPLTLQPIVENAVKHGMDPDSDPLHISIRTCETNWGSEIIVEDDGLGFKTFDNSEPHVALDNIQQRLELMCNGKISITSRDGGGTIVKVEIPLQVNN